MDDDPVAAALKAEVPLLFLCRGCDAWVPVSQSMEPLNSMSSQRSNIESAVIAEANHELMFSVTETMQVDKSQRCSAIRRLLYPVGTLAHPALPAGKSASSGSANPNFWPAWISRMIVPG
jgi:hypothetical protein